MNREASCESACTECHAWRACACTYMLLFSFSFFPHNQTKDGVYSLTPSACLGEYAHIAHNNRRGGRHRSAFAFTYRLRSVFGFIGLVQAID